VDALTVLKFPALEPATSELPPPTGLLQAFHTLDATLSRRIRGKPGPAEAASAVLYCNKTVTVWAKGDRSWQISRIAAGKSAGSP
jgi:hypothetical protein